MVTGKLECPAKVCIALGRSPAPIQHEIAKCRSAKGPTLEAKRRNNIRRMKMGIAVTKRGRNRLEKLRDGPGLATGLANFYKIRHL